MAKKGVRNKSRQTSEAAETVSPEYHWSVRLLSFLTGLVAVGLLAWVVIRNEPFKDVASLQIVRALISITMGLGVLPLPGYLGFTLKEGNRSITAAGALGFAVLTYLFSPVVAPSLDTASVFRPPPAMIATRAWTAKEYLLGSKPASDTDRTTWLDAMLQVLERTRQPCFVIESSRFEQPHTGFTAAIRTIPTRDPVLTHRVLAFHVHDDDMKSFTPLVSFNSWQGSQSNSLIQVPATAVGDYLLIVLVLTVDSTQPLPYTNGDSFPFQLHRI